MKLFVAFALTAACLTAQAQRITWTPVTSGTQAPTNGQGGSGYYGYGNTPADNDKTSRYGGSVHNTFGSNGSTATTIGGSTFIRNSDGSNKTCQTVGVSTFCN